MRRTFAARVGRGFAQLAVGGMALGVVAQAADAPSPAAAAPVVATEIVLENGVGTLRGPDSRHQIIVTGKLADGRTADLTRQAAYSAEPAGVVQIDATGLVTPLADGEAKVTAKYGDGKIAVGTLTVKHFAEQLSINFPNQITPIFTKLGCNGGGCHGKASGQNGFKLSLLGFEPKEDFEYLVKEGRGRRVSPAAPDLSLLLQKGINAVPHGGGRRLEPDSYEYRLLRRWVAQGMPYGADTDPKVVRIETVPHERTLGRQGEQQIAVLAHYSDGSTEDVTRTVTYNPNDPEMGEASPTGLVKTFDLTGDLAVMARYQGQVDVFRAGIPLGAPTDSLPAPRNFVDELVFAKLKTLGVPASPVCDDSTFLRRATLDVAGRLPTLEETRQFLADADPNKRDRAIDRLLDSSDYAEFFANKWAAVLRNKKRNNNQARGTYAFHDWIRSSLIENKPYDQFVREVLAAAGELGENPAVVWYREVKTVEQQVEDTAQLFLGLRIQCARCHHHPFEKWSQRDYYGYAAFFSQVGRKMSRNGMQQQDEERIFHKRGIASANNPKTGENLKPTGLGSAPLVLKPEDDPRQALVDWMAAPENPFFSKALVNRYWKHFFSRGIVDPEDDMRVTNPASNPALLDALAKHFVDHKFDMKDLIRTILQSKTYQLSAEPNEYNVKDKQNYSRYYPKRLNAEVLYDSLHQLTLNTPDFNGVPQGTRAVALPDSAVNNYFLTVFGKPSADTACECERSAEANLAQSLHLLNSNEVQAKLSNGNARAAVLARDARPDEEKVREIYLVGYSREPSADELAVAAKYIAGKPQNKQQAYEDLLWALVNSKEFLFNH